jgi:hypothetical protein
MGNVLQSDEEFGTHIDEEGKRITPVRSRLIGQDGLIRAEKIYRETIERFERFFSAGMKARPQIKWGTWSLRVSELDMANQLSPWEILRLEIIDRLLPVDFKVIDTKPLREVAKFKEEVLHLWSQYEPKSKSGGPMLLRISIEEKEEGN